MSIETTPQELAIVQAHMQGLRTALMEHAHQGALNAGFADRHARFLAVTMTLLGAAQLYALSINGGTGLYELFKAQCAMMARSKAADVVRNSALEIGPETAGGIVLPD